MKTLAMVLCIFFACSSAFSVGCERNPGKLSASSVVNSLSELIEGAPKSIINLDQMSGEELYPDKIIGDAVKTLSSPEAESEQVILSRPLSCVVDDSLIYLCDALQHAVFVFDTAGHFLRAVSKAGPGPGEFKEPAFIAKNENNFFVAEGGNSRVQIFNRQFVYQRSIPALIMAMPHVESLAASSNYVYVASSLTDSMLITVYDAIEPFTKRLSFLPQATTNPRALAFNQIHFSMNAIGICCVGYTGLPYLFVFNAEQKQVATIEFTGKRVEDLERPPPTSIRTSGGTILVKTFIWGLDVTDGGEIFLATRSELYVLVPDADKFKVQKRWNLRYRYRDIEETGDLANDALRMPASICVTGNRLYVCEISQPSLLVYQLHF